MATNHELTLYVMTGCPYCIKVKRFLADNGVTIPERNISTDTEAAEAYEKDEWPKGRTIKLGRPSISDEPSVVLSARVGESVLDAFDAKAKRHGQTRTERLRELITLDAMIA